ncbi:MAG: SHOCT domain-containing protein [Clostridia bacterium]|nr:SHOCT domain-containing protein [Clostridia bacterium]
MEVEQFRRKAYGFVTLCIAVLTLVGLVIPVETVVEYGYFSGMSNSIALWYMGFKSDFWLAIIIGILSWLQFIFAVAAIVVVALSFKRLSRYAKLINKAVALGGVALTGVQFLLGLTAIICNCIRFNYYLSELIFTSFSFVPFALTSALLIFMAKVDKKYARQSSAVDKKDEVSDIKKITEYKKMLDAGVLTQAEFDELKTKILYGEGLQT